MTYFDDNKKIPELFYSRVHEGDWVGSPSNKISEHTKQTNHPALLSIGDDVWLAWLETGANCTTNVMGMTSVDGGKTWASAQVLLCAKGKVDYPKLLQYKGRAYLAVNTVDGLKVKTM